MSAALDILAQSAIVIESDHSDSMVLMPMAVTVQGYAQDFATDPQRKAAKALMATLHIAGDLVNQVVWVRNVYLSGVTLANINYIVFQGRKYVVKHYSADPVMPDTAFYCQMGTA